LSVKSVESSIQFFSEGVKTDEQAEIYF
jgi:hypothetical protein